MDINRIKSKLLLSTAVAVIAVTVPAAAQAQTAAQNSGQAGNPSAQQVEEVVVTGSSIRGVSPIGSNLITVNRDSIDKTSIQTVQQLLKTVPSITGMQSSGQGGYGSSDAAGTNAPTIHGLGGVSSNSTLVLIDGHRIPNSGIIRSLGDPNLIPTNAIERLEVLPDGSSSIYGSDAVAGVVNVITRHSFSGLELTGQKGFGDQYDTYSLGVIGGRAWNSGSVLFAYDYSNRSSLAVTARNFDRSNQIPRGGNNYGNFACSPATIQPTGSSLIYQYPYTAAGISNAQANAPCNQDSVTDLLPSEIRHAAMVKIQEQVTDRLTLSADAVYSIRNNRQGQPVGTITARIFGPGSNPAQINPFYVQPVGVNATSETVRFDPSNLLGTKSYISSSVESMYANVKAEYKLSDTWQITSFMMAGLATSRTMPIGALCNSCALLALNGTTNTNGVTTTPSIVGSTVTLLNTPLTSANALDPFNPAATNRTSPAVLAGLLATTGQFQQNRQELLQYNIKLDGTLLTLPAGDVKVAIGGEYVSTPSHATGVNNLNLGPTVASSVLNVNYPRNVRSAYGEILLPVISEDMNIPLVRRLDLNVSGRYDDYSDFGATANPKFAANWEIIEGLKVRGSIARSFVAPPVGTIGVNGQSLDTNFGASNLTFSVPLNRYPTARLIPGCAGATTTCTFGTTAIPGMQINGSNPDLKQQTGNTWSVGADYAPTFLGGLIASVTYWHNAFKNGVTSPAPQVALQSDGFASLLQIYPTGATPAQMAAFQGNRPQTTILQSPIYFSYDFRNQNALNLNAEGIDADIHYQTEFDWGSIGGGLATSFMTKFDEQVGTGGAVFSVLNRSGFNNTFPSVPLNVRTDLNVTYKQWSGTVYVNYSGPYTYWGANVINPVITTAAGIPTGGGDHVTSYTTVDLNVSYDLGEIISANTSLFVDVTNLFDRSPNFVSNYDANRGMGYDFFQASPIGRVVTVGFRAKL